MKNILYVGLFFLFSCKREAKPVYCDPNLPFHADFKIGENLQGYGFVETDTIIQFAFVTQPGRGYTSHQWKVGDDPRVFTSPTVGLSFSKDNVGEQIPVTLYAKGRANPDCFTGPEQLDTVRKTLTVLYPKGFGKDSQYDPKYVVQLPIFGTWKGFFQDTPADTFTIHVVNQGPDTAGVFTTESFGVRIYNLPKGCSGDPRTGVCGFINTSRQYFGYPSEVSYKAFYSSDDGFLPCCPKATLYGHVAADNPDKLLVECTFFQMGNDANFTKRIFEGIRQ